MKRPPTHLETSTVRALVWLIRIYQGIAAPLIGPACRFDPSCSRYAEEAVCLHGPVRGVLLTFRRILRCRPGGGNGFDPVPAPPEAATSPADSGAVKRR